MSYDERRFQYSKQRQIRKRLERTSTHHQHYQQSKVNNDLTVTR